MSKLELMIACVALIVLFLVTKSPNRGQADVTVNPEIPLGRPMPIEQPADTIPTEPALDVPTFSPDRPGDAQMHASPAEVAVKPTPARVAVNPPQMALVNTSNCTQLGYQGQLRGRVGAEWVWNGVEMVPMKVCTVDEGNGVTSVWSFNSQGKAVIETTDQPTQGQ